MFFAEKDLGFFCSIIIEHFRMEKSQKIPQEYNCIYCNYNTFSFKDYNKHFLYNKNINKKNKNKIIQYHYI